MMSASADPSSPCTTLADWRATPYDGNQNYLRWLQYSPLLSNHGIELFECSSSLERVPPRKTIRRHTEPGLYRLHPYFPKPTRVGFRPDDSITTHVSPLIHPAQASDGGWLMLRVVRVRDEGLTHLNILRCVSTVAKRSNTRNHCLPMLVEIPGPDITFAAFQYMTGYDGSAPDFYSLQEVLEFMEQTMDGLVFLRDNLIAHRDIAMENIVWNLAGSCMSAEEEVNYYIDTVNTRTPWRSQFPIRYFFIDFELATMFPTDSDPATRTLKGLPASNFSRFCPKEYLSDAPYDPFAADVWCMGLVYWDHFRQIEDPKFQALFEPLLRIDPTDRPTAEAALAAICAYRRTAINAQSIVIGPRIWERFQSHPDAGISPHYAQWIERFLREETEAFARNSARRAKQTEKS